MAGHSYPVVGALGFAGAHPVVAGLGVAVGMLALQAARFALQVPSEHANLLLLGQHRAVPS